jgi:hypothetical protein
MDRDCSESPNLHRDETCIDADSVAVQCTDYESVCIRNKYTSEMNYDDDKAPTTIVLPVRIDE